MAAADTRRDMLMAAADTWRDMLMAVSRYTERPVNGRIWVKVYMLTMMLLLALQ